MTNKISIPLPVRRFGQHRPYSPDRIDKPFIDTNNLYRGMPLQAVLSPHQLPSTPVRRSVEPGKQVWSHRRHSKNLVPVVSSERFVLVNAEQVVVWLGASLLWIVLALATLYLLEFPFSRHANVVSAIVVIPTCTLFYVICYCRMLVQRRKIM